jgi:hypothetical protein
VSIPVALATNTTVGLLMWILNYPLEAIIDHLQRARLGQVLDPL